MSGDYSLPDVLERIYDNQLALEAAVMELTLWVEQRASQRSAIISVEHWKLLERTLATSNRAWPNSRVRIAARHQLPELTSESPQANLMMGNIIFSFHDRTMQIKNRRAICSGSTVAF